MIWGIIAGILMIMLIVVSHELGHFITGKLLGFSIEEFSVGMGPKIWQHHGKNTVYSLRALPLGGYCKFTGEDEDTPDNPAAFNNRPKWQRLIVLVSGGVGNFIAAFLAAVLLVFGWGLVAEQQPPVIHSVMEGYSAQQAGIQPGDLIIEFNGQPVNDQSQLSTAGMTAGQTIQLVVQRGQQQITANLQLKPDENGNLLMGVRFQPVVERPGLLRGLKAACQQVWYAITSTLAALAGIFFRGEVQNVGGIVAVVAITGQATANYGISSLVSIAILVSANLGLVNLLPLPALDGGRVVLLGIEAIRRKPLRREVEGMIHTIGLAAFFLLAVVLIVSDIIHLPTLLGG